MASVNDVFQSGTYTFIAGNLPAGTPAINVFNGTSSEAKYLASAFPFASTKATAVVVDAYLDILAGTDQGLAEIYYNNGVLTYSANLLKSGDYVHGLYFDSYGNLYAAATSGLYAYVGTNSQKLLFSDTAALCIYIDGAGTIYAGTATGLRISKDSGSAWTTELSGHQVNSVVATAPLYSF
jgi:ligand-binding sensor domain-containing protein